MPPDNSENKKVTSAAPNLVLQVTTSTSSGNEANVATPSIAYENMTVRWAPIDALLGGTPTMQALGEQWLPKEPAESPEAYNIRLSRSILFNAFKSAVKKLSSKPFCRPLTPRGELPERLEPLLDDADRAGTNMTQLARQMMEDAVAHGKTHVLVDFPRMPEGASLEKEREIGARPTFVHVKAAQLIGWKSRQDEGGGEVLTEIRIAETRVEPVGTFGEQLVPIVRVFTETTWQVWRFEEATSDKEEGKWVIDVEGLHSFGGVPMATLYLSRTGFMTAEPPLEDLAWENIHHWQSQSDQTNILRFTRFGMIFGKGLSDEDVENGVTVGPNRMILTKQRDADMKYIEHSGKAIEAGENDLKRTEEHMELLGMAPMVSRSGGVTATARAIDEASISCDIQAWVRGMENFMQEMFDLAATWTGEEVSDEFKLEAFNDFALGMRAAEDLKALQAARATGDIQHLTFLKELKLRGVLSETVNVEEEVEALEIEPPEVSDPDDVTKENGAIQTGETNEHSHELSAGDSVTGPAGDDQHVHPVEADGTIGQAAGHTHAVTDAQRQTLSVGE